MQADRWEVELAGGLQEKSFPGSISETMGYSKFILNEGGGIGLGVWGCDGVQHCGLILTYLLT